MYTFFLPFLSGCRSDTSAHDLVVRDPTFYSRIVLNDEDPIRFENTAPYRIEYEVVSHTHDSEWGIQDNDEIVVRFGRKDR